MNSIALTKTPASDLEAFKCEYRKTLSAPLDGMWEHFTTAANHYAIKSSTDTLGFCAVNAEHKLMQFSVVDTLDARELFGRLVVELKLVGAILASFEDRALALCMDLQKTVSVKALMYHMPAVQDVAAADFPPDTSFDLLRYCDLQSAVDFAFETLGQDARWLSHYFGDLIEKEQLFALRRDGEILAIGECRVSETQKPYVDLGMVVGKAYRRQGLGTNVLRFLVRLCQTRDQKPICSTECSNVASQKAIAKVGFVCRHRMLEFSF